MRGKEAKIAFFVLGILLISGVLAAETPNQALSEATQCLRDEIIKKSAAGISFDEAVFSALALGSNTEVVKKLDSEIGENCWPKSSCALKETAQGALAYNRLGKPTAKIQDWILSGSGEITGINWYLQIDIERGIESECTLEYGTQSRSISIDDKMKIQSSPGGCFELANSGYWLKINKECLDEKFKVSCDEDFTTSILYQKGTNGKVYISEEAHSAGGLGSSEEEISAKCFVKNGVCDYEGSLWATLFLDKAGVDVKDYLPYLVSFAEDNGRYFPSAFLYLITESNDYYSDIVQNQKQSKYWEMTGSKYNRFYDSALGMLALFGSGAVELDNAKLYFTEIQQENGCWNNNNIKDTALLIYGGWVGFGAKVSPGTGSGLELCSSAGFTCEDRNSCLDSEGEVLENFDCSSQGFGKICCSVDLSELSCEERNGILCVSGQSCSGSSVQSSDGSCCIGSCQVVEENVCELFEGECKSSCGDREEEVGYSCGGSSGVCCIQKESGGLIGWIITLIILIVLAALGIIYRHKIILWWHKRKGKLKTSPVKRTPIGQVGQPRQTGLIVRKPVNTRDREFEETLRKLKDIGK
jgi:hypothetical protein